MTIGIKLNLTSEDNRGVFNYWKFNSSLLCNKDISKMIKKLTEQYWKLASDNNQFWKYWELLKYENKNLQFNLAKN